MGKPLTINKGYRMEEVLRNYFLRAGYFVVRGVPFNYEGFTVTDIDLWLYNRTSSIAREIIIVDSKNKKTPQAIERIFWIQGLKQAIRATSAVVATTETRQEVKDFGRELNVLVLDGSFLAKLNKSEEPVSADRLTDEEFFYKIDSYTLGKLDGNWKGRFMLCKTLLSKGLSFDNCNEWLTQARFFAEQSITKPNQREIALRCFYIICSFIAVSVDFSLKEFSFLEQAEKTSLIRDGFTYGSKGSTGMKKVLDVAMGLVEQHAPGGSLVSNQVRKSVVNQLSSLNTEILGEYFSKNEVAKTLFTVARELENLAMRRVFTPHTSASVELRGLVSCILDYWGIDRVLISGPQPLSISPAEVVSQDPDSLKPLS